MKLSNRAYAKDVSRNLAEMGLERALRSFYANTFSSWTLSGTTATRTLDSSNTSSLASSNFGSSGLTASISIRVDNYDGFLLNAAWVSTANYRPNDLVGYNGTWYRCALANSGQTPSTTSIYWVLEQAPVSWTWKNGKSYVDISSGKADIVYYNNVWYRCILSHTASSSITPYNSTYWTTIGSIKLYNASEYHSVGDIVYFAASTTWYRCTSAGTPGGFSATANISWQYLAGTSYVVGDVVCYYYSGLPRWYICIQATSTQPPGSSPTYWTECQTSSAMSSTNALFNWSSSNISYNQGDVVYYGSTALWYRCIVAHTSSATITPSNTTYWATAPLYSWEWDNQRQYSLYDRVRYNGVWYLSLQNSNNGQNPATATSYWIGANTTNASYTWNASTSYSAGDYRCYGGVWYKCLSAGAGQTPSNSTYWTATWTNSWGVTTGAPVIYSEGRVILPDGSATITTQLRAVVHPAPLFPNAAGAIGAISANSGGTVDSYDSNLGTYASQTGSSTNYSAVIASTYSAGTAITLTSTDVKGYLAAPSSSTTPYAPLYSSGGSVKGYSSPASPNIDKAQISRSPFVPKFDTIPGGSDGLTTYWSSANKGNSLSLSSTTAIGIPGAKTPVRYYYNGTLTIGGSSIQYLNINGPVILYVNGDLFITDSSSIGRINVASTGSAEIHVAGAFKSDAGGEGILSYNTDPKSLIIISDSTSTTSSFYSEGVNPLYGTIYAPYTTSINGYYNNNNSTNIYGAVSAAKITYSGANMNIHYDTSLRSASISGVDQPYAITDWRELTDPSEKANMP